MAAIHLTELGVKALKTAKQSEKFWDDATPGFGIRVGKRSKTWVAMRGRNRELVTIGHFPAMGLSDARTEAKRLLAVEPEAKSIRRTFLEARDEFLEAHYADKSAGTKYQVERSLKRHGGPLEAMQLVDIEDGDLNGVLEKLKATPSEQLHLFRYLRTLFRWCTRPPRRYLRHSPMEGYEAPSRDKRKSRILADDEIKAVWYACQSPQEAAVRLILLWGTRRGETAVLEPSWRLQEVLTIPGEHTKNHRSHAIPICPLADHILPSHNHSHYFTGRWGDGHITPRGLSQVVGEVMKRSGTSGWTPHDLRRTFRSLAARVGVSREIAELLMNHAPPTLDDIYDRHSYVQEKRDALLKIEGGLLWLLVRT